MPPQSQVRAREMGARPSCRAGKSAGGFPFLSLTIARITPEEQPWRVLLRLSGTVPLVCVRLENLRSRCHDVGHYRPTGRLVTKDPVRSDLFVMKSL
jgi:hypothetical protein